MNIVILTADEPLYLPAFFARLLAARVGNTRAVFTVAPLYGKDSPLRMIGKYISAFGVLSFLRLALRIVAGKFRDRLKLGRADDRYGSISSACAAAGVPCESIDNVNDERFHRLLRALETELIVSVSCPQIFRKPLIELPPRGCLNVHGAPLPKYRGIAPSFWMMCKGETSAAVTVFFVNEDIDAGDVVEVEEFDILEHETLDQFIIRSKRIACDALLRAIRKVEAGSPPTRPLDAKQGSYFGFPTRRAYREFRRRGRKLW